MIYNVVSDQGGFPEKMIWGNNHIKILRELFFLKGAGSGKSPRCESSVLQCLKPRRISVCGYR